MSRPFSLEDEEQHVGNLLADPVLKEGREKAMHYDKAANDVKAKYGRSIQQQHHEKEQLEFASLEHERESAATAGGPSLTDRIAAGARQSAASIQQGLQTGLQSASAALRMGATEAGGTERDQNISPNQPISSTPPTHQVPQSNPEAASEPNAAWKIKEALQDLGKRTREASSAAFENLRQLAIQDRRIAVVCKQEFQQKPCPQTLLVCCTVLLAKGLDTPSVFDTSSKPALLVESHAALLEKSLLAPNSMDPVLAAAVIKHFLASLDEPLLTRKLADQWIAAGSNPADAIMVMADLPLANLSALRVLMETCQRLATYSSAPGVDAQSLATALVPVLLWRLPLPGTSTSNAEVQGSNPQTPGPSVPGMNIQALRSRLLSFKFGSGGAVQEAMDEEGKPRLEDGINSSNKEEDAMLDSAAPAVDAGSLDPEGDTKGPAAATSGAGEKPKLSKQEAEAVACVIQHLIQHFDECFMTANA